MGCGSSKTSPNTDAPDIEAIEVLDSEPGYPAAKPPTTKKKDIFDEEKYKETDEKSSKIKVTNELTYELLTTLTKDMKSDLEKLRAIFYFVGSQDIEKQYYPGVTDPHTPRGYMKLIKLKKGHYQGFFALLCRAANLPCMILHGKGKSVGYEVGDKDIGDLNSSWNAVYVDGQWRLIHPHWAFTGVRGYNSGKWMKIEERGEQKREPAKAAKGKQVSRIDEYWFMPDPDQFVYFCIADDPNWQLLEEPWTEEKFVDVPYFQVPYFTKSEMTLSSSHKAMLTSEEGMVEITFEHDDSCKSDITYELFFDEEESKGKLPNKNDLPRCVFVESTEKVKRLIYRFQVVGVYKTMLFCGGTALAPIVSFKIECKEASSNPNLFPLNPPIGYGYSHLAKENGLLAPSEIEGVVQTDKNKPNEFEFRLDQKQNIGAQLCHNDFTSQELQKYIKQETEGDRVHFNVAVPEHKNNGEFALQIFTVTGNKKSNVVNYLLTDRKDDFVSGKEKERNRLIMQLKKAIEGDDPDKLEKAMDQFEKAKINDMDGDLPIARKRLQELKKNNQLKMQLKKAIEGNDPDQLKKAIHEFEKAKIDDKDGDIPIARKRLQELSKNNPLKMKLKKAIEGDDLNHLEDTVAEFEKAKIPDDDGDLPRAYYRLQELSKMKNVKRRLKKAMKGRSVRELEAAIDECESAGIPDDDSDLVAAKERLRDMQDNMPGEDEIQKLRKNLRRAIGNRHMEDLEKAITQCEENGLSDDDDVIRGRQLLVELYEKAMERAMKSRNVDELQRLVDSAKVSPVAMEMNRSYVMPKAERFLRQQARLQKYLGVVLELKPSTVSEIHRYPKPHMASYQAVVATYLILGEEMAHLKRWNDVRSLLRMNGQRGIIRRIKKFNMDDLDDKGAEKAKRRLDRYTLDEVKLISAGAAAFYIWSSNIVMEELASEDTIEEEDEERDDYEESNTSY